MGKFMNKWRRLIDGEEQVYDDYEKARAHFKMLDSWYGGGSAS